ncbi:MAG TPA: protocatechuate 3,4-dioxygenase subunit alpha [Nocardioidaceae bacterium]|nr:protocatechuate 3,4-dioxygenase subunit alpha [Nocardioidaceae bacterium]
MTEYTYEVTDTSTSAGPTPSQTVGPFFHYALPYEHGPRLAGPDRPGVFRLAGRVVDGEGNGVSDALVEVWQADEQGRFVTEPGVYAEATGAGFRGFGRCATDFDGRFELHTVKPGRVPTVEGRQQAPHLAMSVFARGMLRRAATRVYFDDEADANAVDPLLVSVEEGRRATLVATRAEDGYRFDVHLQGDRETVFLDVFAR